MAIILVVAQGCRMASHAHVMARVILPRMVALATDARQISIAAPNELVELNLYALQPVLPIGGSCLLLFYSCCLLVKFRRLLATEINQALHAVTGFLEAAELRGKRL